MKPHTMEKTTYLKRILGESRFNNVRLSKVLMVGAGGIGCELLKDLVLIGYGEIHIVDLDTVTLSNLNRQFLFRKKDIDKSKSLTVVKAVEKFNFLDCKLVPFHGNIMDSDSFSLDWWDQYDYVYNALDNLEARRYVNSICLFLKKPLMESGSTGFEGQIQPIYPYKSECFDCQAKVTPTTFPVCTIRSTPSKPVHAITWAKEFLFQQLFAENQTMTHEEIQNQRKELEAETDDKQEIENLLRESNDLNDLKATIEKGSKVFIPELLSKIFVKDIERLLSIESLWKFRTKPQPLTNDFYEKELNQLLSDNSNLDIMNDDTKIWTLAENIYVLFKSSERIVDRLKQEQVISFDKDDDDTLNFVVAAANLRCFVFNIEVKSKFDIKQIAGNIIPAIATTNAIISGFSSLESLQYFTNKDFNESFRNSSTVFVSIKPNKYITGASLFEPNEKCASCSLSTRGVLYMTEAELTTMTLNQLVDDLKSTYDYEDISLMLGKFKLIYDFDFEDNLNSSLKDVGFKSGETLLVQDEDDKLENLELYIYAGKSYALPQVQLRPKKIIAPALEKEEDGGEGDDLKESVGKAETIVLDDIEEPPAEEIEIEDVSEQPPTKKQKV